MLAGPSSKQCAGKKQNRPFPFVTCFLLDENKQRQTTLNNERHGMYFWKGSLDA